MIVCFPRLRKGRRGLEIPTFLRFCYNKRNIALCGWDMKMRSACCLGRSGLSGEGNGVNMDRLAIEQLLPEMVEWRRHLHRHPELSYQEKETSAYVAARLAEFGIEVRRSGAGYGLTGILKGTRPGKTVVLRADMDALNITEENGSEYASQNKGVMHACGHDGHTAMLLAAASYYSNRREEITGELRFLFQPAEEICPGGAQGMIAEGVLEGQMLSMVCIYGLRFHWAPSAVRPDR